MIENLEDRRLFAFGVTTTTGSTAAYVIDNGGDLKFNVLRPGATVSSTIHLGDITSVKYKNQEMMASYANASRYSHYEQGLGSITTITTTVDNTNGWILVTCDDSAETSGAVIQYYAVRRGDNNIYMGSLPLDVNNGPGEGRFIAYLNRSVFTAPEVPSDNAPHSATDTVSAIEGSDVFGHSDGTTSSKFFNMGRRMIENDYHGLTGTAGTTSVGAWMFMGSREHSAGGPFFKDIDFQASSTQVEMYNCIFTGHTQTESYRQGLHTYAMQFTNGAAPAPLDLSWFETMKDSSGNLLMKGLIPAAQRGAISGKATGNPAGSETVVTLSNSTAQYWDMADSSGNYAITGVQPGTYVETMYRDELAVGTKTVTITAGTTTSANIVNTLYTPPNATFKIGTFDGTPREFLNADKIETEHPSDVRMSPWVLPADATTGVPTFHVGTDADSQWPMIQFMGVNNANRISFNMTAAQAAVAQTLRIGITLDFEGGRNRVTINAGQSNAWTSGIPSASRDLNSRGITRGTWRGENQLYTYNIPASAFRVGTNTLDLGVVSGSYVAGQTWLSPNVVYDAIDLVPTSTASSPTIASVAITPANSTTTANGTKVFTAVAKDSAGNVIPTNFDWTASGGSINPNGASIAPATPGGITVTALATRTRQSGYSIGTGSATTVTGTITGTGTTTITVVNAAPTIATAATATPSPVTGTTTVLSVLGADDASESALTYTWAVLGTPPASVSFSANATNAAKNTTATFAKAGTYTFRVTVTDAGGATTTSDVSVLVNASLNAITVSPASASVAPGATSTFTANGFDQFGQPMSLPSAVTWAVSSGGGSIDQAGVYTATATPGEAVVQATVGSASATAAVTIADGTAPTVVSSTYAYQTSQAVSVTFSEDVIASIALDDLVITNVATGVRVPASEFTVTTSGAAGSATTATWTHNLANGMLPDGNYRATLLAGSVADASGNANTADATVDFFVLAGDLNHDRAVNFADLVILAQNYNTAGKTFGQGNADYSADGSVGFADLVLLAQHYNATMQAPAVAALVAPTTASTAKKTRASTASKVL